jgi:predicted nucleic acid-binding protein
VTFLLDVNVLIALIDPSHVNHAAAHDWFTQVARDGWATCPIVENGVIRILSHSAYPLPDSASFPGRVAKVLPNCAELPGTHSGSTISACSTWTASTSMPY